MPTTSEKKEILDKVLLFVVKYKKTHYPSPDPDSQHKWRMVDVNGRIENEFEGTEYEDAYKNDIGTIFLDQEWGPNGKDETWTEPYATSRNAKLYYAALLEELQHTFRNLSFSYTTDSDFGYQSNMIEVSLDVVDDVDSTDDTQKEEFPNWLVSLNRAGLGWKKREEKIEQEKKKKEKNEKKKKNME